MSMNAQRRIRLVLALGALALAALAPTDVAGSPSQSVYRVTIVNLSESQPFSPPVAATP
jgi:hypothetical protein